MAPKDWAVAAVTQSVVPDFVHSTDSADCHCLPVHPDPAVLPDHLAVAESLAAPVQKNQRVPLARALTHL